MNTLIKKVECFRKNLTFLGIKKNQDKNAEVPGSKDSAAMRLREPV